LLWRGASDERQPFRDETSRRSRRSGSRRCLWRRAAPLPAGRLRESRAAPVDLTANGEPAVDEPEDAVAPGEVEACDEALCPDEPAIPWAAGTVGRDPPPTDGTPLGEVAPGTDGVDTVGVWIAGVVTGGGAGGVTVTGGGVGTETVGTVTVGTVAVGTVTVGTVAVGTVAVGTLTLGTVTEGVGTEVLVGAVSAVLAWGRPSSTTIVAARLTASATADAPCVQTPAHLVSLSWTRLGHPLILSGTYPFL
jgi:hypothetical protein